MKFLKIWNVVLWLIFAWDVFSLVFAIIVGSSLWWLSLLAVLVIILCLIVHRNTMEDYNYNDN